MPTWQRRRLDALEKLNTNSQSANVTHARGRSPDACLSTHNQSTRHARSRRLASGPVILKFAGQTGEWRHRSGASMAGWIWAGESGSESTEMIRRHASWMFSFMVLLHSVLISAFSPSLGKASLVTVVFALLGGFAFRWLRRATVVLAVATAFYAFVFMYLFGIIGPMAYLAIVGAREWIPWATAGIAIALATYCSVRVRASLHEEFAQPLERAPGVHIATQDWILSREVGLRGQFTLGAFAVLLLIVIVPGLYLTRNTPAYLTLAMLVGPLCISVLCTDPVARWVAFNVAVRRWEAEHGIQLRFPPLPDRRSRSRKGKKLKRRK